MGSLVRLLNVKRGFSQGIPAMDLKNIIEIIWCIDRIKIVFTVYIEYILLRQNSKENH